MSLCLSRPNFFCSSDRADAIFSPRQARADDCSPLRFRRTDGWRGVEPPRKLQEWMPCPTRGLCRKTRQGAFKVTFVINGYFIAAKTDAEALVKQLEPISDPISGENISLHRIPWTAIIRNISLAPFGLSIKRAIRSLTPIATVPKV